MIFSQLMQWKYPAKGIRLTLVSLLLVGSAVAAVANATKAWRAIESIQTLARENEQSDKTDEHLLAGQMYLLQSHLESFIQSHPQDKNWWHARLQLPEVRCRAASGLGMEVDWQGALEELASLVQDPALPARHRASGHYAQICLRTFRASRINPSPDERAVLFDHMERFGAEFPRHHAADTVQLRLGEFLRRTDPPRAERAFKVAARSANIDTAAAAEREIAVLPYRNAPLDMEFVAIDGRKVNLEALRGRVVLIDFWATWCGPCVRDMPNVIAAYQKYRDQGFEVIGISLDENLQSLRSFVTRESILWPQYYDGLGWENRISRRFKITSIPEMWLIDREGRVVSTEIWGGNLEFHLKRELAKK